MDIPTSRLSLICLTCGKREVGADPEDLSSDPHLDAPSLVGQEESQDEKQALVAVCETWSEQCLVMRGLIWSHY